MKKNIGLRKEYIEMKPSSLKAFIITAVFALIFLYHGCDDSGNIYRPPIDSIHYNYINVIVTERSTPATYSVVDLLTGRVYQEVFSYKDVILVDSLSLGQRFNFVSGNAFGGLGFETRFRNFVYDNLTQRQFDTIKLIPGLNTLSGDDFPDNFSGCFSDSIPARPVIGFFLKGKYEARITQNPVFGVLYIDSTYRDTSSNFYLRFDVKMNKSGQNEFR